MSERGKILLCISSQKAPKQKRVQQEAVLPSMFYFNILCDICFYGGAKHFWRGRICYREGSCSRQIWHASPQYVPTIVSCSGLSTDNPGIATTLLACPSFGQLQSQAQHLPNMNECVRKNSIFVLSHASHSLVISTFVVMPCILGRAKLRTKWTIIALACNMFCLNVFPKTRLVLGCPQAVLALPQITSLVHLWRYFRIKI